MLTRRQFSNALLAAGAAALASPPLRAQGNTKPIRILVGFSPGGSSDVAARVLADKLTYELGVAVYVDNRPGAGGQIAAQALKASPADGNTLFLSHDHTISILPLVTPNLGFDPAQDFVAVAGFASFVNCFALSSNTPAEAFLDYVKWVQRDGQGRSSAVGVPAPTSTPEFLVKVLADKYRMGLFSVPYRGGAPLTADMLGNQIPSGIAAVPDFIENHRGGRLRIVAVLGASRDATLPDVPTFGELGLPGFEDVPYYGLFAPKGTPQARIDDFGRALERVLAIPSVREALAPLGLTVEFMTQQQLATRERAYARLWANIIKEKGFAAS